MRWTLLAALVALGACNPGEPAADAGSGLDAGSDGGADPSRYHFFDLAEADELTDFDLALGPDGRVGVVYYKKLDTHTIGTEADYELRYLQWQDGVSSAPERIRVVQRMLGVDIVFAEGGQPIVAYLGGDTPASISVYWHQSDAALARRSANGTWTEELVAQASNEAPAPADAAPISDQGFLVGLFPALAHDGQRLYLAWRDCHFGQFPQQDWNASDLEIAIGNQGAWQKTVVIAGGSDKQAWGGHLQMVLADGRPAIVSDQVFGTAGGAGQNLVFSRQRQDGSWGMPIRPIQTIGDTQSGPSLAWDPVLGFAIAVVDRSSNELFFTRSVNDGVTWSEKDPVFASGSGGWYPSLSVNPVTHEPSIAFYVCSSSPGGSCNPNEDRLVISERISNIWREHLVDPDGAWKPKLAHLPDGRRVLVYRHPQTGTLKLAVER
jgi:hypothetical protein